MPIVVFPYSDLINRKVLNSFQISYAYAGTMLTNLLYYFLNNEDGSFSIRVVYFENSWLNLFYSNRLLDLPCWNGTLKNELCMDKFEVPQAQVTEMRRLKNKKAKYNPIWLASVNFFARITLGHSKFNVDYFLDLLNGILIQKYEVVN